MQELIKHFEKADLLLKIAKEPFGRNNRDVFGITILRKLKGNIRTEYFSMWPGNDSNRIEVVSVDPKRKQLVLMVHEQRRLVHHHLAPTIPEPVIPKGAKDVEHNKNGSIDFTLFSPSAKRHMLLGVDERQLFIAQLPRGVSTISEAHKSLKTTSVTLAEGKISGRTVRQGEWFLLNATEEELDAIKKAIKSNTAVILRKVAIGADSRGRVAGKPHTADELVKLPALKLEHGFTVNQREDIFIRGKVRHKDHKTVAFKQWRKVIRNAELAPTSGINWID